MIPLSPRILLLAGLVAALSASPHHAGTGGKGKAHAGAAHQTYHVDIGTSLLWSSITANVFIPNKLTIHVNDSVTWTNVITNAPQTVTFGPLLVTPPLIVDPSASEINPEVVKPQGGTVIGDVSQNVYSSGLLLSELRGVPRQATFTFPKPGIYLYRSLFHPSMQGEVDVVPAGQPVTSPQSPDTGPAYYLALRSAAKALDRGQVLARNPLVSGGTAVVMVGDGNENVSLNRFLPNGLFITSGTTVLWQTKETSGDLHALVLAYYTTQEQSGAAPLYTGITSDGGLKINPDYATASLPSGTHVVSTTFSSVDNLYTSGILYGSDVEYPSQVPDSYRLTFDQTGAYYYVDPFHPDMLGVIDVIP